MTRVDVGDTGPVRLTEFWSRMDRLFGPAYAGSYAADQVLAPLGGRTVLQALADGEEVKTSRRSVGRPACRPASNRCSH